MATTSTLHEADLEFRNEVISKLLDSVDCAKHMKDSFGQFLGSITADANHKHLAYHLFCIVCNILVKYVLCPVPRSTADLYRSLCIFQSRPL